MNDEIVKSDGELNEMFRVGKMLAMTGYFDTAKDVNVAGAQMAAKIMAGRELGFPPFASVNGIHIIKGKPTLGANLIASAVKAHPDYDYTVEKMADDEVVVEFFRLAGGKRSHLGRSSFSMKDAQKAGLLGNANWKNYPRNMMFARAISNGQRWYCPNVFNGNAVYTPEELGEGADMDAEYIIVEDGDYPDTDEQHIDTETGEIYDDPFEDEEPESPDHVSKDTFKRLHATGKELYGDDWDDKRPELVESITTGATKSSKDLTEKEAKRLIAGMKARLAKLSQPDAEVAGRETRMEREIMPPKHLDPDDAVKVS